MNGHILHAVPLIQHLFRGQQELRMPWEGPALKYRLELYNALNQRN